MKPAPFTYHDPKTAAEAAELLGRLDNARVLAGGQSLMPMMNFRYVMPDHIIDINGITLPSRASMGLLTQPISCIGLPVLAAPIPVAGELPMAIQIIAAPWRERDAFRVAAALVRAGVCRAPVPPA